MIYWDFSIYFNQFFKFQRILTDKLMEYESKKAQNIFKNPISTPSKLIYNPNLSSIVSTVMIIMFSYRILINCWEWEDKVNIHGIYSVEHRFNQYTEDEKFINEEIVYLLQFVCLLFWLDDAERNWY